MMKSLIVLIILLVSSSAFAVDFTKEILPILEKKCFECHSSLKTKPKGKLRVDELEHVLKGGKNGSFIVPEQPEKSLFYKSVILGKHDDDVMPPTGKGEPVSKNQQGLIKKWILDGAKFGNWKKSTPKKTISAKSKNTAPLVALADQFPNLKVPASESGAISKLEEILEKARKQQKISRNDDISDENFVRRIYISIAGRIPTLNEAKEFLDNKDKNKRDKLIDRLVDSEAFVSNFYNYWADVLRIKTHLAASEEKDYIKIFAEWIKESFRENKPYDVFVREMLSSTGNAFESPGVGYFYRDKQMPLDNMAYTTQVFLGTQLDCAMCHDHPFDQWSQLDFYQLGAFVHDARYYGYFPGWVTKEDVLNGPSRKRSIRKVRDGKLVKNSRGRPTFEVVVEKSKSLAQSFQKSYKGKTIEQIREHFKINGKLKIFGQNMFVDVKFNNVPKELHAQASGQVNMANDIVKVLSYNYFYRDYKMSPLKLPDDYQYDNAKPKSSVKEKVLFGASPEENEPQHQIYAKWITSSENPKFTRMIANRLFQYVFGLGLYAAHDDLKSSSECSNPELMAYLEKLMQDRDFDMKAFLKILYKSPTFQASAKLSTAKEMQTAAFPYYFPGPVLKRMSAEQIWDSLMTMIIPAVDHRKRYFRFRDRQKFVNMKNMTGDEIVKFCIEYLKKDKERLYKNRSKDFDTGYITKTYKRLYLTEPDARHAGHKQEWLRASELPQVLYSDNTLRVFGRTDYTQVENSNRSSNVPQALYLLNGVVDQELTAKNGFLWRQIMSQKSAEQKIESAFLGILSRRPTSAEKNKIASLINPDKDEDLKDLFWALINNEEFRFHY
ncbi:MAG: PSD1 and planctomycete cytochrome C domain-containing protein [Lentisphaeraceae bacterium]|nr:PSD1 and planctomycete cytochrome C domain-containing protein [Lentisphaeraceae bacterium]